MFRLEARSALSWAAAFAAAGLMTALLGAGCREPGEDEVERTVVLRPREATPSPGPPTVTRLVLEFDGSQFRVVSRTPKRGTLLEPDVAAGIDDLRTGTTMLVRYRALGSLGGLLATGLNIVPLKASAEFLDPDVRHRIRRLEDPLDRPVVKVNVPFHRDLAVIEFERLHPDESDDPRKWRAESLGRVELRAEDGDEVVE